MEHTTSSRIYYLDWLRIFAIAGVLLFHSAMPYVADWGWHLKNSETSHVLLEFNFFLSRFRMPLLFFISGAVGWVLMQKISHRAFLALRFKRLFIPLVAAIFLIVPPQIYFERLSQGYTGSFWDCWLSTFDFVPYPNGNTSWHHMWFVAYLFLYDIIAMPVVAFLQTEKGSRFLEKAASVLNGRAIYLILLLPLTTHLLLNHKFPRSNDLINDLNYFLYWGWFFMAGLLAMACPAIMESITRLRREILGAAFILLLVVNGIRWNGAEPGWDYQSTALLQWPASIFDALMTLLGWTWVLALVGYGRQYLNRPHASLPYTREIIYPFYILHQTVIVVLTYYIIQSPEGIGAKYLLTVLATFMICMMIIHTLVRPFQVPRFLLGMKANMTLPGFFRLRKKIAVAAVLIILLPVTVMYTPACKKPVEKVLINRDMQTNVNKQAKLLPEPFTPLRIIQRF